MGSGGAKKTNQMLAEETRRSQDLQDVAAQRSADIYNAGRGDINWGRGELMNLYKGLGAEGAGGGGGGGPAFTPMEWESSTEPFYRNIMQSATGLYTPEQIAAMKSAGSDPITAAYEGLARNLSTERAGRGLGYGSATSGIMRDKAYDLGRMGLQSEADIADKVVGSRMSGAGALTPIESEKRAFKLSERDKALASARAAAGRAAAGAANDLNTKRSLISQILGLEGDKDLAYMDRQMGGMGLAQKSITSRVDETPAWQKALMSTIPAAGSAALGAFLPTPKAKKKGGGGGIGVTSSPPE